MIGADWKHLVPSPVSFSRTDSAEEIHHSRGGIFRAADQLWFNHARYDALKRLTSASSTPISGSTPAAWTQTFSYDGFGNLTGKTLNGTTTPISVTAATNRLANSSYDANGNMLTGVGATLTYDGRNRLASASPTSGGTEYYGYGPDNKRIYRWTAAGSEEWTFYGARGEKIGTFGLNTSGTYYFYATAGTDLWFAGQLIVNGSGWVTQDRVGSDAQSRFYPYGDEITSTPNDREKYATYFRDSFTTLDYADQRYYASGYGRFNSADPYMASANGANDPKTPLSWNKYSYVLGDPVNGIDPQGTNVLSCGGADGFFDGPCGFGWWGSSGPVFSSQFGRCMDALGDPSMCNSGGPIYGPPEITCEGSEIAYVRIYLSSHNSPFTFLAAAIVSRSDAAGIDDRFIVALAQVETGFGTNPKWDSSTAGIYNVFDNGAHCAGLKANYFCQIVNPYTSYSTAISDVISTLASGKYYQGLDSVHDVYDMYERGDVNKVSPNLGLLDDIYSSSRLGGNLDDIRTPRCP